MVRKISAYFVNGLIKKYSDDIKKFVKIIDLFYCCFSFYFYNFNDLVLNNSGLEYISIGIIFLLFIIQISFSSIYSSYRNISLLRLLNVILIKWLSLLFFFFGFTFITRSSTYFSRYSIVSWSISLLIYLLMIHLVGRKIMKIYRSSGGNSRKILFFGSRDLHNQLKLHLNLNKHLGMYIHKVFLVNEILKSEVKDDNRNLDHKLKSVQRWLKRNEVDLIWFDDKNISSDYINQYLSIFGDTCVPIYYFPPWFKIGMSLTPLEIGNLKYLEIWRHQNSELKITVKRLFDILFSLTAIIFLSPLLLIIFLIITFDSHGPIIFKQYRYGLDGRQFQIYKFRTMKCTQEKNIFTKQAKPNDSRITRVGKYLRMFSLDELPQLFNVLIGDMSIVGPRPHAVDHNEYYRKIITGYMQRHSCKPGITGLAQIRGHRGNTESIENMQKRIDADLQYLSNWTVGGDLKILFKTIIHLLTNKAY